VPTLRDTSHPCHSYAISLERYGKSHSPYRHSHPALRSTLGTCTVKFEHGSRLTRRPVSAFPVHSSNSTEEYFYQETTPTVRSPTSPATSRLTLSPTSTKSDASLREHRLSDFGNYRREVFGGFNPSDNRSPLLHQPSNTSISTTSSAAQIAPWMAGNGNGNGSYGAPGAAGAGATSFFNDSSDNLSLASQLSPSLNPAKARLSSIASFPGSIDLLDHHVDGHRRPSIASVATTASTGSKASRGGLRKLQGFFGEEFPGRDSSEGSLATAPGGKERASSYTQSRTGRDRNHSNATDHAREVSPTPSRPKTPVPAPDVVPFLYQEADVCRPCPFL
jgi:adenylate cyclase